MPGTHWGSLEELLIAQMNRGVPIEEVEIPGKSKNAIRTKAIRLGLIKAVEPRIEWPRNQIRILRKYQKLGLSVRYIYEANVLGDPYRSLHAIRQQWKRKKLSNRKISRAMRRKKIWKEGEFQEFVLYLKKFSTSQAPRQIAKKWKISRGTVSRWQNIYGLKLTLREVKNLPYSKAVRSRARKKIIQKNKENWNRRIKERREKFYQEAANLIFTYPKISTRICLSCEIELPLRTKFWHCHDEIIRTKQSQMRRRFFKHTCRECVLEKRRNKNS